jgi:hypothetical protein
VGHYYPQYLGGLVDIFALKS